ncbi:aspartate carbamoyltransferase [Chloroflexota bacterium]
MSLKSRSLVTIDDFSNGEMEAVFSLADTMSASVNNQLQICQGKIMASLFFEPSTRTRLSFEAAMHRLGGNVIGVADVKATSLAKGESLADMAKVVGSYADIIVVRHPWEGAARVVADYAGVPVINAGDGSHEHPTQTLCDLFTIKKERGTIKGLKIALWGDLKYGRTVRSLTYALARFGATILFRPGPGFEIPEHVIRKLTSEYGGEMMRAEAAGEVIEGEHFPLDAIYITPSSPHQLVMMPSVSLEVELKRGVDALYVTRLQKERLPLATKEQALRENYPVVDKKLLKGKEFQRTLVMHPLPRVDELAYDIDADPRSMYFKQAARGVPVRMALLSLLLGCKEADIPADEDYAPPCKDYPVYDRGFGVRCSNPKCVSMQKTEARYVRPEFKIVNKAPLILRCVYCEHEVNPRYVASSDWHEGTMESKKYHSADSSWARRIRPENLIIFESEAEARAHGFKPSSYVREDSSEEA